MIDIVIVNWNSKHLLSNCLESIQRNADGLVCNVIVVDNASTDGSANALSLSGVSLKIIRNKENLGFGNACNQGAAGSMADFILFLNPDTELFAGALRMPYEFMSDPTHESVGICGIKTVDENGVVQRHCRKFPGSVNYLAQALGIDRIPGFRFLDRHLSDWDHQSTATVDHVIGAFYFVRRSLFERLDGFDSRFFMYFEDQDFSLRTKKMGYSSVYLSSAKAFHACGGSSHQVKAHRLFYSLSSRLLYSQKHFSTLGMTIVYISTFLIEPWTRIILSLKRQKYDDLRAVIKGYVMLLRSLPGRHKLNR